MGEKISISVGDLTISAQLNDSEAAQKILEALPLEGITSVWGEEIYFEIPIQIAEAPDARADVDVGEMGYWPFGAAFCIFFGPTPVSVDEKPRAYSPVNVLGRLIDDPQPLKSISNGAAIRISRL
jgi:uncharacterized protein